MDWKSKLRSSTSTEVENWKKMQKDVEAERTGGVEAQESDATLDEEKRGKDQTDKKPVES